MASLRHRRTSPPPGRWGWHSGISLPYDAVLFPQPSRDSLTAQAASLGLLPLGTWNAQALQGPGAITECGLRTFVSISHDMLKALVEIAQPESGLWDHDQAKVSSGTKTSDSTSPSNSESSYFPGILGQGATNEPGAPAPNDTSMSACTYRMAKHLDSIFRRLAEERKILLFSRCLVPTHSVYAQGPEAVAAAEYAQCAMLLFHTGLYSKNWDPVFLACGLSTSHDALFLPLPSAASVAQGMANGILQPRWRVTAACTVADICSEQWWAQQGRALGVPEGIGIHPLDLVVPATVADDSALPRPVDALSYSVSSFGGIDTSVSQYTPTIDLRVTDADLAALLERSSLPALRLLPRAVLEMSIAFSIKAARAVPGCLAHRVCPDIGNFRCTSAKKTLQSKQAGGGHGGLSLTLLPHELNRTQLMLPLWVFQGSTNVEFGCNVNRADGALVVQLSSADQEGHTPPCYVPYAILELPKAISESRLLGPLHHTWLRLPQGNGQTQQGTQITSSSQSHQSFLSTQQQHQSQQGQQQTSNNSSVPPVSDSASATAGGSSNDMSQLFLQMQLQRMQQQAQQHQAQQQAAAAALAFGQQQVSMPLLQQQQQVQQQQQTQQQLIQQQQHLQHIGLSKSKVASDVLGLGGSPSLTTSRTGNTSGVSSSNNNGALGDMLDSFQRSSTSGSSGLADLGSLGSLGNLSWGSSSTSITTDNTVGRSAFADLMSLGSSSDNNSVGGVGSREDSHALGNLSSLIGLISSNNQSNISSLSSTSNDNSFILGGNGSSSNTAINLRSSVGITSSMNVSSPGSEIDNALSSANGINSNVNQQQRSNSNGKDTLMAEPQASLSNGGGRLGSNGNLPTSLQQQSSTKSVISNSNNNKDAKSLSSGAFTVNQIGGGVVPNSSSGLMQLQSGLSNPNSSLLSGSIGSAPTSLFPSTNGGILPSTVSQTPAVQQAQAQTSQSQPLSMAAKIAASEKAKQQQQQVQTVNPPAQVSTNATLKKSTSSPSVSSTQVLASPSPPPLPSQVSMNDQEDDDALVNALNSGANLSSSLLSNGSTMGVSPSGLPMLSPRMRFKGSVLSIVIREDKPHGFICVTKKREPELWSRVQREAPDTMRKLDGKDVATIVFQAADAVEGEALKPLGEVALQLLPSWKDAEVSFEVEYSARFKRYVAHRVRRG